MRRFALLVLLAAPALPAAASDWLHWRGPEQNGHAKAGPLPGTFGVTEPGKDNLLWKTPIGGRSAPILFKGKLYFLSADGDGLQEGERAVCLDAASGKQVWEKKFRVFHTDIVSNRLGWTSMTCDPEAGTVFCHGTQGHVFCFDAATGDVKWQRNLTEEFGRITGYGGRIASPIFDSGVVVCGMVNSSWGNHTRGASRFVAFDGKTGDVAWWAEGPAPLKGTYYSNPVIAVINGQRLLVTGGADGHIHAFMVRTGERVWSYRFSEGVVNPSPIVDGTRVYVAHGEENPGGGPLGKVACLDAGTIDPKTKTPKLVWDTKRISLKTGGTRQNIRFGLASPALADGVLYMPDDAGELYAFDAATGKGLWTYKYGIVSRAAPLVADGKLYVFGVFGELRVLKLNGQEPPEELEAITLKPRDGVGQLETNGTFIAADGRLYFHTREDTYCVGNTKPQAGSGGGDYKPLAAEAPVGEPAAIRVFPAEVTTKAGSEVKLTAEFVDANGRAVKAPEGVQIEWTLPPGPLPPTAKPTDTPPPPLKGTVKAAGLGATVTVDAPNPTSPPAQQGYVLAKAGKLAAPLVRVRVAPQVGFAADFERLPPGVPPSGWVNAAGKFVGKKLPDGSGVLAKVNTDSRPPFARAIGYVTPTTAKNYVIQCDLMGTEVRKKLPDMGVVNSRYSLVLDGKPDPELGNKRTLRLISWEARPRINKGVAFDWQPGKWYTAKFAIEYAGGGAKLLGKVWEKGQPEPADWTVTFDDPAPNTEGAAGIYGYVTNMRDGEMGTEAGSDIFYDNLKISPAK